MMCHPCFHQQCETSNHEWVLAENDGTSVEEPQQGHPRDVELGETAEPALRSGATSASGPQSTFTPTQLFDLAAGGCDRSALSLAEFPALFDAIGVDISTVDAYVFCFKLRCAGCWTIEKSELLNGLPLLGLPMISPAILANKLPCWKREVSASVASFKEFYTWAFQFVKVTRSSLLVPVDEALPSIMKALFSVAPPLPFPAQAVIEDIVTHHKFVSHDLWLGILLFSSVIKPDLSNYDETVCWNSAIDDFVERWRKARPCGQ